MLNGRDVASDEYVWKQNAQSLADWAMQHLVNRSDNYGTYAPGPKHAGCKLTPEALIDHFSGKQLVGLHSTSPDHCCRWFVIDVDQHEAWAPHAAEANFETARGIMARLESQGFAPILEDSDGNGSFHIWTVLAGSAPCETVFRFAKSLAGGNETFPKQSRLGGKGLGNWIRLPGRHHTRSHWSRCWGDGEWLTSRETIELLLSIEGDDPLLLPDQHSDRVGNITEIRPDPVPQRVVSSHERLHSALNAIDPDQSYDDWLAVGQALHNEGDTCLALWNEWSSRGTKFKPGECEAKWSTFTRTSHGRTLGTIFHLAKQHGWHDDPSRICNGNAVNAISVHPQKSQVHTNPSPGDSPSWVAAASFAGVPVPDLWPLADEPIDWLVENVLSADQPTVFGAKQKSLKTTLLVDLAVSLVTGLHWLDHFVVPKMRRVLFITGESSQRSVIRKLRRAAVARNLSPADFGDALRVEALNFPTVPNLEHCLAIAEAVEQHEMDVVILDPLYMGLQGVNTANLTEVGPALRQFMQFCRPAEAFIAHHVKKTASFDDAPELEDLSQAGIAEFAGNYWLMGRMAEYVGDGLHTLAVRYGGREEQFGLIKLEFNEREWTSQITSLLAHREFMAQRKDNERFNRWFESTVKFLNRQGVGQAVSIRKCATNLGTKPERECFWEVIEAVQSRGVAKLVTARPNKHSQECECLILNDENDPK